MLKTLKDLWEAVFHTPTITDDVVQRTHKAAADVRHCDTTIEKASFQRHMAIMELVALEYWNHGLRHKAMPDLAFDRAPDGTVTATATDVSHRP